MTVRDPGDIPPADAARRRDAALLKMLKTPHKKQAELKKPSPAKQSMKLKPRDPWKER